MLSTLINASWNDAYRCCPCRIGTERNCQSEPFAHTSSFIQAVQPTACCRKLHSHGASHRPRLEETKVWIEEAILQTGQLYKLAAEGYSRETAESELATPSHDVDAGSRGSDGPKRENKIKDGDTEQRRRNKGDSTAIKG